MTIPVPVIDASVAVVEDVDIELSNDVAAADDVMGTLVYVSSSMGRPLRGVIVSSS